MAKASKPKVIVRYRDAETGNYVTPEYAKAHPKTTVRETEKVPPKKKP